MLLVEGGEKRCRKKKRGVEIFFVFFLFSQGGRSGGRANARRRPKGEGDFFVACSRRTLSPLPASLRREKRRTRSRSSAVEQNARCRAQDEDCNQGCELHSTRREEEEVERERPSALLHVRFFSLSLLSRSAPITVDLSIEKKN